jgi:hypothetical protein
MSIYIGYISIYITSHPESSNPYSGHTAVPLEPRNSSPINAKVKVTLRLKISQSVLVLSPKPLSAQAQYSRFFPISSSFRYNGSLVTWTVVCLTVASQFSFPYSLISSRHGLWTENTILLLLHGADHTENTCNMPDFLFIGPLAALGVAQTA